MKTTEYYEATLEALTDEATELKMAILMVQEDMRHLNRMTEIYISESASPEYVPHKDQVYSMPWITILDMQRTIKKLQELNQEMLVGLLEKKTKLNYYSKERFGIEVIR